jgi:mRNA interferase HigB
LKIKIFPKWELYDRIAMRIINAGKLKTFGERHRDATERAWAWFYDVQAAEWKKPIDIKKEHSTADVLADNRVVFNIKGNRYRIVVRINYEKQLVEIRFAGAHAEYDHIDASTI